MPSVSSCSSYSFDKINKITYLDLCRVTTDKQFNTGDKTALSNLAI
jgi:hypothetical protein